MIAKPRLRLELGIGDTGSIATSFIVASEGPIELNEDESSSWNDSHPLLAFRFDSDAASWSMAQDVQRDKLLATLGLNEQEPRRIGRYVVLGLLGRGGMSTVLEAHDTHVDRRVALKLLHSVRSEAQNKRLLREAQALAKLSHPNVVQVFEIGVQDGKTFVAMELLPGKTLQQWQDQWPRRPWKECVEAYLQAGLGLAAAHQKGLVHRDFKPSNCIINDEGRVQVLDFGLAAQQVGDPSLGDAPVLPLEDVLKTPLTQTGTLMGTIAYMAPEQLEGLSATPLSDQFSFCVSLHEAIFGTRPLAGIRGEILADSNEHEETQSTSQVIKIPYRLKKALSRGLAVRAEDRWPTMAELVEILQRMVTPRTVPQLAARVAAGLVAGSAVVGVNHHIETMNLCSGAKTEINHTWNSEQEERIRRAILATKSHNTQETWESVDYRFDHYVAEWTERYTEACRATSIRNEQSEEDLELRLGCLREQRAALEAYIDVLARAGAQATEKSTQLTRNLPALTRCDDVALLRQQQGQVRPPWDPWLAGKVKDLRAKLPPSTITEANSLARQANDLGYAPLTAEVKLTLGRLNFEKGGHADAERELREAHALAVEHGHREVALASAADLTLVIGFSQSRDDGIMWGRTTIALAERDGSAMTRAASFAYTGLLLYSQKRFEDAQQFLQQKSAKEAYERAGLPPPSAKNGIGALIQSATAPFTRTALKQSTEDKQPGMQNPDLRNLRRAMEIRAEIVSRFSLSHTADMPTPHRAHSYARAIHHELSLIDWIASTPREWTTLLMLIGIIMGQLMRDHRLARHHRGIWQAAFYDDTETGTAVLIPYNPRNPWCRTFSHNQHLYFPDRPQTTAPTTSQAITAQARYELRDRFRLSSLPLGLLVQPKQARWTYNPGNLASVDVRLSASTLADPLREVGATGE